MLKNMQKNLKYFLYFYFIRKMRHICKKLMMIDNLIKLYLHLLISKPNRICKWEYIIGIFWNLIHLC